MRRSVRPFIKEFKTRSAKSSATHPQPIGDADNDGSKPSFLDLNVFTTRQNKFDDEHKVALTAADAVFGRSSPVAPPPTASPLSIAPAGRVLPSLTRDDDVLIVRLTIPSRPYPLRSWTPRRIVHRAKVVIVPKERIS